jgi:hypothetical protein
MIAEVATSFDWIRVWEIFLGASLAFIFGAVLQWRLIARQEKFQLKMEQDRADHDDKTERRRLDAERKNTTALVEAQKTIAMNDRNARTLEESRKRSEPR